MLGRFLSNPWVVAVTTAAAVLGSYVTKLGEAGEASHLAKVGANALTDAQSVLGGMFDLTSGKLEKQNELLRLNARLTAINLRADAAAKNASSAKVFGQDGLSVTTRLRAGASAYHPSIDWQATQTALSVQWPGSRRVHVQPFDERKSVDVNIGGVIQYATKYRAGRWIGSAYDYWPAPWMAEYYDWADRFSQGWKSLRCRISPRSSFYRNKLPEEKYLEHDIVYIEPMYSSFSFNSFPILNTDWT